MKGIWERHLPHAEAPLRAQQRRLMRNERAEAPADERPLLLNAAVECDGLRIRAQPRLQLPVRAWPQQTEQL